MKKNKGFRNNYSAPARWTPLPEQKNPSIYYQGDGYEKLPHYQRWLRKQGRFWWLWWFFGVPPPKKLFKILKKAMFNLD
jgi:hypothetical protein